MAADALGLDQGPDELGAEGQGLAGGSSSTPSTSTATVRIVRNGGVLTSTATGHDGTIVEFVGAHHPIQFTLMDDDQARVIPILPDSTVTGRTTSAVTGEAVSSDVACDIVYGDGGILDYPLSADDTASAGALHLTISVLSPDAADVDTYGPMVIKVRTR